MLSIWQNSFKPQMLWVFERINPDLLTRYPKLWFGIQKALRIWQSKVLETAISLPFVLDLCYAFYATGPTSETFLVRKKKERMRQWSSPNQSSPNRKADTCHDRTRSTQANCFQNTLLHRIDSCGLLVTRIVTVAWLKLLFCHCDWLFPSSETIVLER